MSKIELLAPAGSEKSLLAAINAGCDAVYLGLDGFNARSRAKNFKVEELPDILNYCHKRRVKVFITFNTLVKNNELTNLIKLIYQVVSCQPDGIIIQDLALFYLLQKLNYKHIHFSTQAGIHNSLGVRFASLKGVERSILARELTLTEISQASQAGETEIFIHGALCYSLSGACLFSSYLGGMSANRGKCKQPCRRAFNLTKRKKDHLFSLKDLELIDFLPQLQAAGVKSLKIEGRMKRPEYVSQVVKAYRTALDNPGQINQAKQLLEQDFGRSKTSYFVGGNVSKSLTNQPFAGIFLGQAKVRGDRLIFQELADCQVGDKIKLYFGEEDSDTFVITAVKAKGEITISASLPNSEKVFVYKVSGQDEKTNNYSFKIHNLPNISKTKLKELTAINYPHNKQNSKQILYIRLAHLEDIKSVPKTKQQQIFMIPLEESNNNQIPLKNNIYWELPQFIPEADLHKTQRLINNLYQQGFRNFGISHISQLLLLSKKINILSNEYVYALNNLAIQQLKSWGVTSYILPVENDIPNLNHYNFKDGIVPIFFTPALFSSRMPVKQGMIKDKKNRYKIYRKGKLTVTYPTNPVSIFSFINKLKEYNNLFIDLSTPNISSEDYKTIFAYFSKKVNPPESSKFNYKKGLW